MCNSAYTARSICLFPFSFPSDRHSGASPELQKEEEKKFKEVGEAFSVLSDQKKKTRYDSGQDLEDEGMNMGGQFWAILGVWKGEQNKGNVWANKPPFHYY